MDTTPHPYFTTKARELFAKAGADPDHASALAAWAEQAGSTGDPDVGVIVAQDGELVAATRYHRGGPADAAATYVVQADTRRYNLTVNEVGLAIGQLRRITGKRLIHVKQSEVCRGAAKFVKEV